MALPVPLVTTERQVPAGAARDLCMGSWAAFGGCRGQDRSPGKIVGLAGPREGLWGGQVTQDWEPGIPQSHYPLYDNDNAGS